MQRDESIPPAGDGRVGLKLIVQDTGIGMSADAAARLFQPFEQTDASITRRYGGTGLGLSICRRIVTLMDGTITVESTPGHGSAFIVAIRLPVATDEPPPVDARLPALAATPADDLTRVRVKGDARVHAGLILVADDHPTNREVMLRQLAILGYSADAVCDGQEALEALGRTDYALLLSDCHMPVMDGFELAAQIRAGEKDTGRRLPVIAITANALAGEAERCIAAGMDGYMAKPVQIMQLKDILRQFLPESPPAEKDGDAAAEKLPALDTRAMSALFDDDVDAMKRTLMKFVDFARGAIEIAAECRRRARRRCRETERRQIVGRRGPRGRARARRGRTARRRRRPRGRLAGAGQENFPSRRRLAGSRNIRALARHARTRDLLRERRAVAACAGLRRHRPRSTIAAVAAMKRRS